MSGRPEPLFPLFASLDGLPGVGPKTAATLVPGGIETSGGSVIVVDGGAVAVVELVVDESDGGSEAGLVVVVVPVGPSEVEVVGVESSLASSPPTDVVLGPDVEDGPSV